MSDDAVTIDAGALAQAAPAPVESNSRESNSRESNSRPGAHEGPSAVHAAAQELRKRRRESASSRPSLESPGVDDPRPRTAELAYDKDDAPEEISIRRGAQDLAEWRAHEAQRRRQELARLVGDDEAAAEQQGAAQAAELAAADPAQQHPQGAQPQAQPQSPEQQHAAVVQQFAQAAMTVQASQQQIMDVARLEFPDVVKAQNPLAVLQAMATQDPARAQRFAQLDLAMRQQQAQASTLEHNARHYETQRNNSTFEHFARVQDYEVETKIPEAAPGHPNRRAIQQAVIDELHDAGLSDAQIRHAWQHDTTFRSATAQIMMVQAARARLARERARTATRKPVPPVQRPGVSHGRNAYAAENAQRLSDRLDRTGNLKDAAHLLAARRAARRS